MRLGLSMSDLVELDEAATAGPAGTWSPSLEVLEAGRARLRVAVTGAHGVRLAARRVWLSDATAATTWERALAEQEAALTRAGVTLMPGTVQSLAPPDGSRVLWVVRPRAPSNTLLSEVLPLLSPDASRHLALALRDTIAAIAATEGAAAPAEPNAWAWIDGELVCCHADLPAGLSAWTQLGPWRWYAPLFRGRWLTEHAALEQEPARLLRGILGPLAEHASLEGLMPVLRPLLTASEAETPAREVLMRTEMARRRWSQRVQRLRRPR